MLRLPVAFIVSVRQDTTLLTVGIADTHGLDPTHIDPPQITDWGRCHEVTEGADC